MKPTIINLTPHTIKVWDYGKKRVLREYPSAGSARVAEPATSYMPKVDGVDTVEWKDRSGMSTLGLPAPQNGVLYIVSAITFEACSERLDLLCPDMGEGVVRDPKGTIKGTTRFKVRYQAPKYAVLSGSVTFSETPRDVDVFTNMSVEEVLPLLGDLKGKSLDLHQGDLRFDLDGYWSLGIPVWGPEDPSQLQVLYSQPSVYPVVPKRVNPNTGPAQLRRYASTGILPERWEAWVTPYHSGEEMDSYSGGGFAAWMSAYEKVPEDMRMALPEWIREIIGVAQALELDYLPPPSPELLYGSPRGGRVMCYHRRDRGWGPAHGEHSKPTLAELLGL